MKKSIAIILLACTAAVLSACPPQTYKYAERDTCDLYLDFYKPSQPNGYSIIYVFGGGFISGSRNMPHTVPFYEAMAEKGYNPINQLVGYILSEDPTYITTHRNARNIISNIDRDELLQVMLKEFLAIE